MSLFGDKGTGQCLRGRRRLRGHQRARAESTKHVLEVDVMPVVNKDTGRRWGGGNHSIESIWGPPSSTFNHRQAPSIRRAPGATANSPVSPAPSCPLPQSYPLIRSKPGLASRVPDHTLYWGA